MAIDNRDDSRLKYLTEFATDLFRNWYVFAITLAVFCGGTMVYLKYASKTYKVKASVLLNIERSNAYGGRADDIMKVYELIEKDKNLQNEIYYFKSTPLVKSVVVDMDLLVSYYQPCISRPWGPWPWYSGIKCHPCGKPSCYQPCF